MSDSMKLEIFLDLQTYLQTKLKPEESSVIVLSKVGLQVSINLRID